MEIIKQLATKNKVIDMIDSCESLDHFNVTLKYIELYYKKFEDTFGYIELKKYHKEAKLNSLKPKK